MTLAPGARLGPYEITGKLGEGGMGEVYRATDSRLRREVAIKVLPEAFTADQKRLARFEREAQLLAQLHHPNIASIFGLDESGGRRALVMELVEGPTLAELLELGPLSVPESVAIARQIAEALEAAHEKGIVHRDLKPQNIKASREGMVKVLDFGLAKALDPWAGAAPATELAHSPPLLSSPTVTLVPDTELGVILGTAAYMAPEQARGMAVDKRADIWAFGIVFYEMLTGRRLFAGDSPTETLAGVLRDEIDFSALPAQTPPSIRRLLERCLERNPKNRLRDIGEARVSLQTALDVREPAVAPSAARPAGWRLAVVAALAVAVGVALGVLLRPAANDGATALRITPITSSGNVISASISPDGRFVAYVESEQGLQSLWLLQLAGGQTLRLIPEQPVSYWGHTFTRDGNSIYFGQRNQSEPRGALYSISTLGGAPKRLLADIDSTVSFSPDGRELTFLRNGFPAAEGSALMVAKADGSEERVLAKFEPPEFVAGIFFSGPAWSPDGERIATAVGRRASEGAESRARLVVVSVADGAIATLADPGWKFAAQADWLSDGKSLAVIARSADQPTSQIWSVSYPGGAAQRVTSDLNDHRIVSLTADGGTLVSITGAISSNVWSVPRGGSGAQRRVSRSTSDGALGVAFSSAQRIVYSANVGGSWGLWAAGLDGADRGPLFMLSEQAQVGFPAIAGDGTVYCMVRTYFGNEIRAIAPDGSSSRTIVRGGLVFGPIALTPDGRFVIYTVTLDGMPRLQRVAVAGGSPESVFERPAAFPAIDPSGTRVAFYHYEGATRVRLGVKALAGGPLLVDLPMESTPGSRLVLRDEGIYVNTIPGDTANVWLIPADGGAARRVTAFNEQLLEDFADSEDGATLAVARGTRLRDAYAITGFAGSAFAGGRP